MISHRDVSASRVPSDSECNEISRSLGIGHQLSLVLAIRSCYGQWNAVPILISAHPSTKLDFECEISTRGGDMICEQYGTRELRSLNHAGATRDCHSRECRSIEQEGDLDTLSASQLCILHSASRPSYSDKLWCLFATSSSLEDMSKAISTKKCLSSLYSMLSFQGQISKRF